MPILGKDTVSAMHSGIFWGYVSMVEGLIGRLRRDYGFPRRSRQKFKIDCVYTDELPVFPRADGSVALERESGTDYRLNCEEGFGSAAFVTGAMGFILAAHIVKELCYSA